MPFPTEDLKQAAADLLEQTQMFQDSIRSADESKSWYAAKVAELREYLNRAEQELLQTEGLTECIPTGYPN